MATSMPGSGPLQQQLANFDQRIQQLLAELEMSPGTPARALVQQLIAEIETSREELHVMSEELSQRERDLTEAGATVLAERQRYVDLFHWAPDPYLVTDIDGTIHEANQAASKLLRVAQDRMLGHPLNVFVSEADRQPFYAYLIKARQQRTGPPETAEWRSCLQPRGAPSVPVSVTCNTFRDADGKRVQWIFRDISQLRETEEAEERVHQALESRVKERTRELEKLNIQLQEKVAELEQFHDVVVGRELKMVELEKVNQQLRAKLAKLQNLRPPAGEVPGTESLLGG